LRVADQSIEDVSFHDCVVRAVARRGRDIVLSVDLLEPAAGGILTLRAVTAIWVDGILTEQLVMEGEDGEIHRIDRVDGGLEMFHRLGALSAAPGDLSRLSHRLRGRGLVDAIRASGPSSPPRAFPVDSPEQKENYVPLSFQGR
jgi:hypothetical protein